MLSTKYVERLSAVPSTSQLCCAMLSTKYVERLSAVPSTSQLRFGNQIRDLVKVIVPFAPNRESPDLRM